MTHINPAAVDPHHLAPYRGKIIVIKFGGNALADDPNALHHFAEDIATLVQHGVCPVIVHGGGPQIDIMLEKLNIHSEFVRGLRVTTAAAMRMIEMVLCGEVNPEIIRSLTRAGVMAIGLSGAAGGLLSAQKMQSTEADYGFVGEVTAVKTEILEKLLSAGIVPVIAPIGMSEDGARYNLNADIAAGAIAGALHASRFLLLTNVAGVLDETKKLIPELSASMAREMIAHGTIAGGMIPKVETCLYALSAGAGAAVIMDGRMVHSILAELATPDGCGTLMKG